MNRRYSRAIPQRWRDTAKMFMALGDEHRQRILLTFGPGERLNVGQVAEVSTLTRSTVSHHLKLLHAAGVLRTEKIGKEVYYWIDYPTLGKALHNVLDYVEDAERAAATHRINR
jgi:ArsR family transcriptional regulator, arsenate/arsenite/antimonite-responsive transcriptional repressor